MIDPFKITNFNRTTNELEEFVLFGILVAGKKATQIAPKLHDYLQIGFDSPFEGIRYLSMNLFKKSNPVVANAKMCKLGKYRTIEKGFPQIARAGFDLRTVSIDELETIYGIGSKTSRFFVLHSRPNQEYVVFDTHISKYLHSKGIVPFKDTPSKKLYDIYEPIAIKYLKEEEGIRDFAKFDLDKWTLGATKKGTWQQVI